MRIPFFSRRKQPERLLQVTIDVLPGRSRIDSEIQNDTRRARFRAATNNEVFPWSDWYDTDKPIRLSWGKLTGK